MKKDTEVKLFLQYRRKGLTQAQAAERAGMSERSARKYERTGKLPSELKRPRTWRTRPNSFEQDWPWVVEQLERDPALQGTALFALLCLRHPDRYRPTQVRTLQRQIAAWRALHGPEREVIFVIEQNAELALSVVSRGYAPKRTPDPGRAGERAAGQSSRALSISPCCHAQSSSPYPSGSRPILT